MSTITRRRPLGRSVATLAATAMIGSGLAAIAVAPAAHAAESVDATFTWGLSQYVTGGAFSFQADQFLGSDGASVDSAARTVTFTGGVGRTDTRTHVTDVDYQGTVQFGANLNDENHYVFKFIDPSIVVDETGNGEIVADVSWDITQAGDTVAGSANDLTLTTFASSADTWTNFKLSSTPPWAGAVPSDTDYGGTAVVDGASWAAEFVSALPSSARGFFYKTSTSASQDLKAPTAFTAQIPGPSITPTVTSADSTGVTISVAGTGFTAKTNSTDDGVYVGLAPAGGLPDVSSPANQAAFAAAAWVGGAIPPAIVDGAFTTTLTAGADKLVAGKAYSIYTWQAHSHSNTTQDTETPVVIDWAAAGATTVKPAVTAPATTYGKAGQVTVRVPGANGTVTLTGLGAARTATLSNGSATFPVPATTAPRSYALRVSYSGEFLHFPSVSSATLTVGKATPKLTTKWAKKLKKAKKSVLVVTVSGPAGVAAPAGTVKAQLKKGKKKIAVKAVTLKNGQVRLVVTKKQAKKLAKGKWKVTVSFSGNASFNAVTTTSKVNVKKK